jgi:hypothetical protein
MNVNQFLKTANNAQAGAFGEAVFALVNRAKGKNVVPVHEDGCDFDIDGVRVDVKSIRTGRMSPSRYKPAAGVLIVMVVFLPNGGGAEIRDEGGGRDSVDPATLEEHYMHWSSGAFGKVRMEPSVLRKGIPSSWKDSIRDYFSLRDLPEPYILYRKVMFDGESPHNLLPSARKPSSRMGWTVFVVADGGHAGNPEISKIIAFPDKADGELPRMVKTRLSKQAGTTEKADLAKIPDRYQFSSLDALNKALPIS